MCTAAQLAAFKRRLAKVDPVLANVIRAAGAFTHTPNEEHTAFHTLARAIAHQQLNGTAAESIFKRFVGLYGTPETAAALLEADGARGAPAHQAGEEKEEESGARQGQVKEEGQDKTRASRA